MTDPRQKNPREGDPSFDEERDRDRITNPNRRQDEDEMNEESQRGGQRSREKDYGSTESKPGGREQQGGRQNDPTRKPHDRSE